MASKTALWFHIVSTFTEVDNLCQEALAAELGAQQGRTDERNIRSFGQGSGYTGGGGNAPASSEPTPAMVRYPRAVNLAKDLAFREAHPDGADLVKMRDGMRKLLESLRKELSRGLSEHEVYSILIPIVIYCDELANSVTRGGVARWEPLQSEKFNIENGGELFYWSVEERLKQQETHPLVFEVFYFCLNDGFVGMLQGEPKKIEDYKERLRKRINMQPTGGGARRERVVPKLLGFPWRYYAVTAGAVLFVYLLLRWFANSLS